MTTFRLWTAIAYATKGYVGPRAWLYALGMIGKGRTWRA